jgi:hypothetical protein
MKLFTAAQKKKLLKNGQIGISGGDTTLTKPVVKLFGGSSCTWLVSEIDPTDQDRAFGLCDLGAGTPELGYIYLPDMVAMGHRIERDMYWEASKTLTEYAGEARAQGRIAA